MRPEESDATVCQSDATALGETAEARSVVVLARASQVFESGIIHYHVPFLAQLVATKDGHPQRAEPNVALAAYRATAALDVL
jgi:hypothetical protein